MYLVAKGRVSTSAIWAEGAASSAAWWQVNVLLVQVCKEVQDPGEHWYLETAQVFSCTSPDFQSSWAEREHCHHSPFMQWTQARKRPVRKPGISFLNQVSLHWDQFSDLSPHGRRNTCADTGGGRTNNHLESTRGQETHFGCRTGFCQLN